MSRKTWKIAASCAALCVAFAATQAAAAINVQVLSSMPQLVSGGDALVKITGATAAPTVTVGNTDVTTMFKGDATKGWEGYVTGLKDGDNTLVAKAGTDSATITLVNHGVNDTLFAGAQQQPFLCETDGLKLGKAFDDKCAANTVVSYTYMSNKDGKWHDFDPKGTRPTDIADTAVGPNRVSQIVRIERGVINRAGYVISVLQDPAAGPSPTWDNPTVDKGWNGKLIYAFGGGVQANYHQSLTTGLNVTNTGASIMNDHLIQLGYALASGTLNVFGNNNNDVTSAETAVKIKEHFVEEFGPPAFTIGYGPSGGSMQQDLIGNNYPGLLDGTIPERLFSDTMTLNNGVISFDQFVDLNKKTGGMDVDGKLTANRQVGDSVALQEAYASGRVNEGGAGLNTIPILDIRAWHDVASASDPLIANVDVHNAVHSKILRARLVRSNGNADNMATVTAVEDNGTDGKDKGEGSTVQLLELKYLQYLDNWITAIQADPRNIPQAQKVRDNRPIEMANACFPTQWQRVTDQATCDALFPYAEHPRMAAGGPVTDDVFKCQLKPIDAADYKGKLTADQLASLKTVFPGGVCDYSKPGVGQVPLAGTWLMYTSGAAPKSLASLN